MRNFLWYAVVLVVAATGCMPDREPAKNPSNPVSADSAERDVRATISELLKVDSTSIPMDKPISEPPLNADDLDLVEIIMELEERQDIAISDDAIERYVGAGFGKGPIRVTPNQLALIVREAPKGKLPKKGSKD
jgi:acyl carrier protein